MNETLPNKSPSIVRIMLVDDSAVIRGLFSRMLEKESDLKIMATASNGKIAVEALNRNDIDVIVLDIEMPVMDGITAIPKLLEVDPDVKIIMASTLTAKNAEVSLRALQIGASDYITKPTSTREITGEAGFQRNLVEKIRGLALARSRRHPSERIKNKKQRPPPIVKPSVPVVLRSPGLLRPGVLAIGSSTGGPQALFRFLADVSPTINRPVFLTQHMPATFTAVLAEHITRQTKWKCAEAKEGEEITSGRIFLAPGDFHMRVVLKDGKKIINLEKGPQINYCRPAVDPMFQSLIPAYSGRILAVVLTGMGADGLIGAGDIVKAGGTVLAQDEASSVVWGMPGAVAEAGLCSSVLPLNDLGAETMKLMK